MTQVATPDLLETIVCATERMVALRRQHVPDEALAARASAYSPRAGGFREALEGGGGVGVRIIAECKRRSPSRGVLRRDYDPVAIASAYAEAGAAAISVLTEPTFFDGSLDHLRAVRASVPPSLPLLRKDFIVDEYQLLEARANGADAVLLIVAALRDADLMRLQRQATALGLAALVEVHDVGELDRALDCGAEIIGVNNRNLRTLEVDRRASEAVAKCLPPHVTAVSESGLKTADDLATLQELGYRAFLIGEGLVTAPDPGAALAELLANAGRRSTTARSQ